MLSKPTSGRSTIAEYRCTARLATEDSGIVVSDTAEPYINNRAPKRRRVHDDIGADEGPGTVPRGASIGPEPDLPVRRAIVKTSPAPSTKTSVEECDTAAPSLPISSWFLGLNLVSEPCRLIWNADGAVIVRSCVATQSEGGRTEAICRRSLAEIWFVDPCEPYRNKVLVLDSFLHSNQKPVDTHLSDHAKRDGKEASLRIAIKFDTGSPTWADHLYAQFIHWLKAEDPRTHVLRGRAAYAKWETLQRELIAARERRVTASRGTFDTARMQLPSMAGTPGLHDSSASALISIAPIEVDHSERSPCTLLNDQAPLQTAGGEVGLSARQSGSSGMKDDIVVLSYPPGQKGAVEIRNSDVGRLEPGRYLNDNLIEFGLKLWLQDLVRDNPELAAQIHVFNSFFYTKLTEGSSIGFDRVRTWTSRFDLFAKKYIIIPINERLHWYLAIICYPEHTLETESRTKSSGPVLVQVPLSARSTLEMAPSLSVRVEAVTANVSASACPALEDDADVSELKADPPNLGLRLGDRSEVDLEASTCRTEGKQEAPFPSLDPDTRREEITSDQPSTYVLTLDSLGMEHPEAVGLLGQYLQYEALDKHQLPLGKSRRSIGKAAHVPDQPNFFDCGIQLLHLTETFMSDPSYYCHLVMTQKGRTMAAELRIQWKADLAGNLRQRLKQRIEEFSLEWQGRRSCPER